LYIMNRANCTRFFAVTSLSPHAETLDSFHCLPVRARDIKSAVQIFRLSCFLEVSLCQRHNTRGNF
jgi:hypothetical protein